MRMTKRLVGRVMRIGRATVFFMGLAVTLALLFGVASTALAGTGVGAVFNLGKTNSVNKISALVGSAAGPIVRIDNNGRGSTLNLEVQPGKAPLTVSPGAGMATGLRAEDAKTADVAGFAQSAGMASNSDNLDGKDSSQFMTASTYFSQSPHTTGQDIGNGTGIHHAEWRCDPGDQLLTGGYRWMVNATSVAVVGSWPSGNSWIVQWANTAAPNQPYEMQIYIKCADTASPAHG
jgi:hypothetical protein